MVEFYKGPLIRHSSSLHLSLLTTAKNFLIFSSTPEYWILGGILLATANLSASVWNILQVYIHNLRIFISTIQNLQLISLLLLKSIV